jgi:hypothetical protein
MIVCTCSCNWKTKCENHAEFAVVNDYLEFGNEDGQIILK